MKKVYIYQIGCGTFGQIGFERLLQLSKRYDFVEFRGIAEINPERREFARNKAKKYGFDIKVFDHTFEMYQDALCLKKKGNIFIYDVSPSVLHYSHLLKSMKFGFWHLTEKPPALTKEEFKVELKLPKKWNCEFIEEENEAVLTAINYIKRNNLKIKSLKIFRESSIGLQKILGTNRRSVGGDSILDKSIHETYILLFLEASKQRAKDIKLTKVKINYLMIDSLNNNEFLNIFGEKQKELTKDIAVAEGIIEGFIKTDKKIPFKLYSSWLGISEKGRKINKELKKLTNYDFIIKKRVEGMKIPYEDFRVFIIECCSAILYGEMKNKKLFVKRNGKIRKLKLINLEEDQLYRVLKNFIFAVKREKPISLENRNKFLKIIFESREKISIGKRKKSRELRKTRTRVRDYVKLNK